MTSGATVGRIRPTSEIGNDLGFPTEGIVRNPVTGGVTMQEIISIVSKRRVSIVAAVVAGLALALIVSLVMVPQYRSSATLEIGEEPAKLVDLGGQSAIPIADSQFLETQLGLLRSRSLAERVARELRLTDNPDFAEQGASAQNRVDQAAATLSQNVLIEPVSESRLVKVGYQSADPELAARISNSFANNFIASNLERRYQANDYARDFLQRRIAEVRSRLEDSERKLVLYAQRQNIVSVGTPGSAAGPEGTAEQSLQSASLGAANTELSVAQNARVTAENRYREAARSTATAEVLQSPSIQSMKTQLAQLRSSYAQKRNELKPDHPEMRELQSGIDALERDIVRERNATVTALGAEYRAAAAREAELRSRVGNLTSDVLDLRGRTIQYTILQRDVDTNRQLYDALLQRFKEVGVSGGVEKNLISIVDVAKRPDSPFKPDIPRNILVGGILGLLGGLGLAVASGLFLNKIKVTEDVQRHLGIPSLGVIPYERELAIEEALATPKAALFEAYAALRSQVLFASGNAGLRSLMITSASPGEGKTTTSLALAQNFARMGKTTVLVDADLRHPSFFANTSSLGLAGILERGGNSATDGVLPTETKNLFLLPAGATPSNPADLLVNGALAETIGRLQERFDMVIVDGPPVLGLVDAPVLASAVEGTVFVFQSDGIRVPSARNAVARLRSANARIIGGVITKFQGSGIDDSYGYNYDYGVERSDKAKIRIATPGAAEDDIEQSDLTAAGRASLLQTRRGRLLAPARAHLIAIRAAFWLTMAFALYSALNPSGYVLWGLNDTVQHTLAFGTLAILAMSAYPSVPLWMVWLGLVGFGAAIELIQLVPALGRDADGRDFVIDAAVVSCVVALVWALRSAVADRR